MYDDLSESVGVEQRTSSNVHWWIVTIREGQQQGLKVNIEAIWINTIWIIIGFIFDKVNLMLLLLKIYLEPLPDFLLSICFES